MSSFFYIARLFRHQLLWLLGGIALSVLTALSAIVLMGLSGWFITAAAVAAMTPPAIAVGFNFIQPAAQIRALAIIRTLARYAERLINHDVSLRLLKDLRCWFFKKMIPVVPASFGRYRSGDILTRMTRDIDALDAIYLQVLVPSVVAAIMVCATLYYIFDFAPLISNTTLGLLLVPGLLLPYFAYKRTVSSACKLARLNADLKSLVIDNAHGLSELTVYGADQRFLNAIESISQESIDSHLYMDRLKLLCSTVTGLIRNLALLLTLVIGVHMVEIQSLSGPYFVTLLLCVLTMFDFVAPLASAYQSLARTKAAAARIHAIAEWSNEIENWPRPYAIDLPRHLDINIENLKFSYSGFELPVLEQFTFNIPQGSRIAVVGESGTGKTTLLNLLMKFYIPDSGVIRLGGIDITAMDQEKLIDSFGLMAQDSRLLESTIRENLLIGDPNANTVELNKVLEQVELTDFVRELPKGLETWVGEDGGMVSGGESRRLCLARVILKNAPILLLDEPTDGLDRETEKRVWSSLEKFMIGKTVILVTHRTTGITLMDNVYKLRNSCIEHQMRPDEYIALRKYSG